MALLNCEFTSSDIVTIGIATVEGSKKLYVGNLSFKCTKEHLSEYIEEFGQVTDVFLPQDNYGKPRGFAFIAVKDEDVEAVIEGTDGKEFMGRPIAVNHPLPPGEKSPKRKGTYLCDRSHCDFLSNGLFS